MVVEEMPAMIGGREKLYEHVTYPVMAREANIQGMVVVGIVIGKDGAPSDIEVLKSVHPILDEAAMEAISHVRFKPGKQRGKPVRVKNGDPDTIQVKLNRIVNNIGPALLIRARAMRMETFPLLSLETILSIAL